MPLPSSAPCQIPSAPAMGSEGFLAAGTGARKPSDPIAGAEGIWQGALEGNGMRLRLQLHVSHDDQKQLVAALDSPDQGVSGLPAIKVSQKDAAFHFEIPVV